MLWASFPVQRNLKARAEIRPGNIFAVRSGKKGGPPTYAGSHLDTQVCYSIFRSVLTHKYSLLGEGMMESLASTLVSKL